MEENRKKIDEEYKKAAEKEKSAISAAEKEQLQLEADFTMFVTGLAMQAFIALGVMPDPQTNQANKNLSQAKYLIDTLTILQEKTSGNLNPEENKIMQDILYDLRIGYIETTKTQENQTETKKEN